jgi:hypothetical protein
MTQQYPESFEPPVMPFELRTPKLKPQESAMLWGALNMAQMGMQVFAAALYPKQTDAAPRIERDDYIGMPGVSQGAQFGPIVRVFRTKEHQEVRFTIWSIPRQGFTTIIPDGLEAFTFFPSPQQAMFRPRQEG